MRIFLTTDLHFGHTGLSKDNHRPADASERILARLGMVLNPKDLLICLGDVCWQDHELWHERLGYIECKKWLCLGNHDRSKSFSWFMEHGWDWVGESFTLKMFGKVIKFSHLPQKDNGTFDVNLHGHFHAFGLDKVKEMEPELFNLLTPKHKLLSIEALHYEPIKLEKFIERNT